MNRFQRRILWWSTLLTAVTGGAYAWMKHLMEPMNEWAVINHPLQPWVLKAHILVAPVMVFAVGLVTVSHICPLLKSGLPRGRQTGIWTAATFGPLVLSGYLIQANTLPVLLAVVSWTHLGLGVVATGAFLGHRVAVGRRLRQRKGALQVISVAPTAGAAEGAGS